MLDDERFSVFLSSLVKDEDEELGKLRKKAENEGVPIIREEMAGFMAFLLKVIKPLHVLEVGCAVGFSALHMRKYLPENAVITTIENDKERAAEALSNFKKAGAFNIHLKTGDATDVLKEFEDESFDFIFMDAAKGQYLNWLPDVRRILKKGGVLVSDNVLFDGDVLQSRYGIIRRDRTIHERLREYLFVLKNTEGLTTSIVNVGDGAALTIKE
ncbi:MAG: O-methyltransferase [Lachnospiraceae bacterium]|nr:O-methyltransferase [Lachnospiraceae bacterium]